jgi:hypothetical protein
VGLWRNGRGPAPTPVVFVSADSKEVAGARLVSGHSERLKVAAFSIAWEWVVSADFKGFTWAIFSHEGEQSGCADSKGFRKTA